MSVFTNYLDLSAIPSAAASGGSSAAAPAADLSGLGDPTQAASQSLSFSDVLSAINPLQHIPVVGTIYRAVTGDTIGPTARVLGGALLGGPLGLIASAANAVVEQSTGGDVGDHVLALVMPSRTPSDAQYAELASSNSTTPDSAAAGVIPATTAAAGASAETPPAAVSGPPTGTPAATATASASGGDGSLAPLSRAMANLPPPPAPVAALGTPGGALGSTTAAPGKGWMLADYRAVAGHGLPSTGNTPLRNTPIPLQTTVPLPTEFARAPVLPASNTAAAASQPAGDGTAAPASSASEDWVSQAMLRGLDRYRDMKKATNPAPAPSGQTDVAF